MLFKLLIPNFMKICLVVFELFMYTDKGESDIHRWSTGMQTYLKVAAQDGMFI
jgi:hypothetical protein